jgi:hypothetical protein
VSVASAVDETMVKHTTTIPPTIDFHFFMGLFSSPGNVLAFDHHIRNSPMVIGLGMPQMTA